MARFGGFVGVSRTDSDRAVEGGDGVSGKGGGDGDAGEAGAGTAAAASASTCMGAGPPSDVGPSPPPSAGASPGESEEGASSSAPRFMRRRWDLRGGPWGLRVYPVPPDPPLAPGMKRGGSISSSGDAVESMTTRAAPMTRCRMLRPPFAG